MIRKLPGADQRLVKGRTHVMRDERDQLSDESDIRKVLSRYCQQVDARDPALVASAVFTEDAIDDHGRPDPPQGRAAIEAMLRRAFEHLEATAHMTSNSDIEVNGDSAHARTYVTAWHWMKSSAHLGLTRPADFVVVAVYNDDFRREPEGWRIAHRRLEPLGPGGVGSGVLPEAFRGFGGVEA
jgi:ketosteroid isomerase-like protein